MRAEATNIELHVYQLRDGGWKARVRFRLDNKLIEAYGAYTRRDRIDATLAGLQEVTFGEIHYAREGKLPARFKVETIEPVGAPRCLGCKQGPVVDNSSFCVECWDASSYG